MNEFLYLFLSAGGYYILYIKIEMKSRDKMLTKLKVLSKARKIVIRYKRN